MTLGIFCGSFNPVHRGHTAFAEHCLKEFSLDRVVFVPVNDLYRKPLCPLARAEDRVRMCELAVRADPQLSVSTVETDSGVPCRTVDTVEKLREQYGADRVFLLTGSDTAAGIPKWYGAERLLESVTVVVARRPELPLGEPDSRFLPSTFEALPISSSAIRRELKACGSSPLLAPEVNAYIRRHGLYGVL